MSGQELAVTEFEKKDNGSGKQVKVSFQNQSEDLFYDFVSFYSGNKTLDTELLDLNPGEAREITIDTSELNDTFKISTDTDSSGIIFSEGHKTKEKNAETEGKTDEGQETNNERQRPQENDFENKVEEEFGETSEKNEEGMISKEASALKNKFEKALENEEVLHPEEKVGGAVPDLSETVKEMKDKTLEDRKEEASEEKDEEQVESQEPEPEDEEESQGISILDSLLHPFGKGKKKSLEDEEEGNSEEEEVEGEEQSDDDDEDELITEKNNYHADRVTTGVINLDEKVSGGFVKGTMNLITGKTGTGKTAFCSNFILEGARKGEPGVYVTTEEREEDILEDINAMFGWDFDSLAEQDKVRVLSIKPVFPSQNMDNISRIVRSYISDLLDQVNEAIEEIGAERVVIDSVSLVQMFIQDEYMSRVALSSLMNNLREAGVTAVLVGSIPETSEGLSKEGIIEYLVDTVILLEFVPVAEDYSRTLKIRKMRRTDHDTDIFPFEVTADGLKVHEAYESI